jgi:hypothetical protein
MAWPPPVLPINRTNAVPQLDTHPADHNNANAAVNTIVTELGADPSGPYVDVTTRLARLEFVVYRPTVAGGILGPGAAVNVATVDIPAGSASRQMLFLYTGSFATNGAPALALDITNISGGIIFHTVVGAIASGTSHSIAGWVSVGAPGGTFNVNAHNIGASGDIDVSANPAYAQAAAIIYPT